MSKSWDKKQAHRFSEICRNLGIEARAVHREKDFDSVHIYEGETDNLDDKLDEAKERFIDEFGERPIYDLVS